MPQVIIDGQEYAYEGHPKLLQFCHDQGVELPHFCYHPSLSIPANCRQCLVEVGTPARDRVTGELQRDDDGQPVIRFFPKLMTSWPLSSRWSSPETRSRAGVPTSTRHWRQLAGIDRDG